MLGMGLEVAQRGYGYPFALLKPPRPNGLALTSGSPPAQLHDVNVVAVVPGFLSPFSSYFF